MTRDDEAAIVSKWLAWRVGKRVSNDLYLEFYETQVRTDKALKRIHVFDVLDLVVNADCYAEGAAEGHWRVA